MATEMTLDEGLPLLDKRTRLLRILLVMGLALAAWDFLISCMELTGRIELAALPSDTAVYLIIGLAYATMGLFVLTLVVFGMWIYRAAANVIAADVPHFEYTAGWCVGWYAVPIANLYKPFAAMRQIWNASEGPGGGVLDDNEAPLIFWWVAWLVSGILGQISLRIQLRAETSEQYFAAIQVGAVAGFANIFLYIFALQLVRRINANQMRYLQIGEVFA